MTKIVNKMTKLFTCNRYININLGELDIIIICFIYLLSYTAVYFN